MIVSVRWNRGLRAALPVFAVGGVFDNETLVRPIKGDAQLVSVLEWELGVLDQLLRDSDVVAVLPQMVVSPFPGIHVATEVADSFERNVNICVI